MTQPCWQNYMNLHHRTKSVLKPIKFTVNCFPSKNTYIIFWAWGHSFLDSIGNQTQHSTGGKEEGKSPGHVLEKLDDLWGLLGRSEGIATSRVEPGACLSICQTLGRNKTSNSALKKGKLHIDHQCQISS